MKISEAVAYRIKAVLKEKNISRYRLEKIIAMPRNTMKTLMSARNDSVNLKTVLQIIRGLDISTSQFFADPVFDSAELEVD